MRRARLRQRAWRYRLRQDRAELRWLASALHPGDVAIDVGAHKGAYTYWMRRRVGDAGRVVAFEPQAALARYLQQCVRDFRWTNVRVEAAGLSSTAGARTLHVPGGSPTPGAFLGDGSRDAEAAADGSAQLSVRVDRLDRYLAASDHSGPIRLIKCDVEGHELEVFRGAEDTLREDAPLLLFECEARHRAGRPVAEVFGYLEELGYQGVFFWSGRPQGVSSFSPSTHQVQGRRPYVNNFVFTPVGRGR
jgi:FkbM family methyltransferase